MKINHLALLLFAYLIAICTADVFDLRVRPLIRPCHPKINDFDPRSVNRISEKKCIEYTREIRRMINEEECNQYDRIAGGRPTYLGEFPHMGALGWKTKTGDYLFKCGSSLISPKYVLTAGHCVHAQHNDILVDDKPKIVRLNDNNLNGTDRYDVGIIRHLWHPDYKPPMKYNDIALMELEKEIKFSLNMRPACLWTKTDMSELGRTGIITGWGSTSKDGAMNSDLLAAEVDLIPFTDCDKLAKPMIYRNFKGLRNTQICAGKLAGGVDACYGDSGGPLQVEIDPGQNIKSYYIIGIVSFSKNCAKPNEPTIYTKVSSYIDWIEENVWPNLRYG